MAILRSTPRFLTLAVLSAHALGVLSPAQALAQTRTQAARPAVEVARIGFAEGAVEVQQPGGAWTAASEGQALSIGDRLRTLKGATARLDFPWTAIAVSDGSEVRLENNRVLTLKLENGRIDIDPEQTLLRIVTAEAAIGGSGRTLVRREAGTTFVGSYNGGAEVEAEGTTVRLGVNKGTIIQSGARPSEPALLAAAPRIVSPASDPRYIRPGEKVRLVWTGREPGFHLEVLSIDSDVPAISLDIEGREYDLALNWLGTFRWRISGRTGPVETQASGEGLICVVER